MTSADFDLPADLRMSVAPIGVMRCAQRVHHEAPRQARAEFEATERGAIVVRQGLQNLLRDLDGFSHVWVLFWCHHSRGYNDLVVPPRDTRKRGLFATRAPNRPNPIGLSALRLLRVDKRRLVVGDHDLLDGTPILDVKPYIAAYDARPDARAGWVDELPADAAGNDHRAWWRDAGVAPPRVYRERASDGHLEL